MDVDLTPVEMECMRCHRSERRCASTASAPSAARSCRRRSTATHATIEVEEYAPKMNVTPNAVALKAD